MDQETPRPTSQDPDQRMGQALKAQRRWTTSDTLNATQLYENRGFRLLELLAPTNFYRWPLWKKLLLAIPAVILLIAFLALRALMMDAASGG